MAFKICTIGCGKLAFDCHGPSYARYAAKHPGVELATCCDLDEAKAANSRTSLVSPTITRICRRCCLEKS